MSGARCAHDETETEDIGLFSFSARGSAVLEPTPESAEAEAGAPTEADPTESDPVAFEATSQP